MRRSLAILAGLTITGSLVALSLSCSKQNITGTSMEVSTIGKTPVYEDRDVAVFRMTGRPSLLAVRVRTIGVEDPKTGVLRTMTWDEAVKTLADDVRVQLGATWSTVSAAAFKPGIGIDRKAVLTPMVTDPGGGPYEGGGNPPDPGCGGCWCCVMDGSVCRCSWGCLKDCYR